METHSDHLMDRVRMDVRDGVSGLKPEDVSILLFERRGLDVRIHSLQIDKGGMCWMLLAVTDSSLWMK